jgi:hypothetical protein
MAKKTIVANFNDYDFFINTKELQRRDKISRNLVDYEGKTL